MSILEIEFRKYFKWIEVKNGNTLRWKPDPFFKPKRI